MSIEVMVLVSVLLFDVSLHNFMLPSVNTVHLSSRIISTSLPNPAVTDDPCP